MNATYGQTAAHYARQNDRKFREMLRREYGTAQYRITARDEVHAYGVKPNTNETGWYFVGYASDLAKEY